MSSRKFSRKFSRGLFLVTLLFFLLLSTRPLLQNDTAITFANFVATTITSILLLLAYLYLAGIQKNQIEIMEAAYTPVLIVNELTPTDVDPEGGADEGDWVQLDLSNVGNEVAKDVSIKVIIGTVPAVKNFTFNPTKNGLTRLDMQVKASQSEGGVLADGNSKIPFSGEVKVDFDAGKASPDAPVFFTNAISAVPQSVERIRFALVLEFTNSAGTDYRVPIRPARVIDRPTEAVSFYEAWEQSDVLPIEEVVED